MNKTGILFFIILLIATISSVLFYKNQQVDTALQNTTNTTPANPALPTQNNLTRPATVPIHTIKNNKSPAGIYGTEGYVVKKYICPPCSNNDQCKPCMANHIIISEKIDSSGDFQLSETEMILFSPTTDHYKIGTKYQFTIKILERKSTSEPINDVEIVEYATAL
jgi:hypothetical protein